MKRRSVNTRRRSAVPDEGQYAVDKQNYVAEEYQPMSPTHKAQ